MSLLTRTTLPSLASDLLESGRLFPSIFDAEGNLLDISAGTSLTPAVNIVENENDYRIELAAPGLTRKDFKVEVENDMLTISAEKQEEKTEDRKNFRRREFAYNAFCRSFTLPENSMPEKIDAKYENGILRLSLPKKQVTISKPAKQIEVA